jgi:hypothetical protein
MKMHKRREVTLSRPRHLSGQAMTEYLVVTAMVGLVIFTPFEGHSLGDYLALALRSFFRNYSFLVSVF